MWVLSRIPWRTKLWLLNATGMLYFAILTFGALAVGLLVTLPAIYGDDPDTLRSRKISGLYIFAMLLLNYAGLRYYSKHSHVKADSCMLPRSSLSDDVRVCRSCGIPSPPRAKHCPLCDVCVLKRDHHCFFGGCCIGFYNQRYFIVFCLYGTLGALYSSFATFSYLGIHYGNVLSSRFYTFLMPWVLWYWLVGDISIKIVAMVIFSYFNVLTCLACLYYFATQCYLVWQGQTSYEYVKGLKHYSYSLGENLRSVFGPFWFLNFLVPLPFLKSSDNGIDWRVVHDFKQM